MLDLWNLYFGKCKFHYEVKESKDVEKQSLPSSTHLLF